MSARISIGQALDKSWNLLKANPGLVIGGLVTYWVVAIVGAFAGGAGKEAGSAPSPVFWLFGLVALYLLVGLMKMYLNLIDGKPASFHDLVSVPFSTYLNLVIAAIVLYIIIAIGFLLLIVPGIYLALRFSQVFYVIIDKGVGVGEAMTVSTQKTLGNKWFLLGASIVLTIIAELGYVVLLVGALVSVPVSLLSYLYIYRSLGQEAVAEPVAQVEAPVAAPVA